MGDPGPTEEQLAFEQLQRERLRREVEALAAPPAMGTRSKTARRKALDQLEKQGIFSRPTTQRQQAVAILTRPASVR